MIYLIGSLRSDRIPHIANHLRAELGIEVFDDWWSPGRTTDDEWRDYERTRGRSYLEALAGHHAVEVFEFDKRHLDRCAAAVLALPAGKSGHLELGYVLGQGKPGYILMDGEPERFDIMYQFATKIFMDLPSLTSHLKENRHAKRPNRSR